MKYVLVPSNRHHISNFFCGCSSLSQPSNILGWNSRNCNVGIQFSTIDSCTLGERGSKETTEIGNEKRSG